MDLEAFEKEKKELNIDTYVEGAMHFLGIREYSKALRFLEQSTKSFEMGQQVENTEDTEYYSFNDNIEFFTKIIENSYNEKNSNVISLNPNYSKMYHILGYLYLEFKNYDEAEEALKKAIILDPVSAVTYLEYAEIYKKRNGWDKFLFLVKSGLKYAKNPETLGRAFRGLGYYFCEMKIYDLASALYLHSLQFDDNRYLVRAEIDYINKLSGYIVDDITPEKAIQYILEKGIDIEISNYVFAAYMKFLQSLNGSQSSTKIDGYSEYLKKMVLSSEKMNYLKSLKNT